MSILNLKIFERKVILGLIPTLDLGQNIYKGQGISVLFGTACILNNDKSRLLSPCRYCLTHFIF